MQFNPKIGFVLGILVTIEIAVSSGTLSLTHAVPADWIPTVTAWSGILAFMGSTVLTFLHGYSSGEVGPLVTPPPLDIDSPQGPAPQKPARQGITRGLSAPPSTLPVIISAAGLVLALVTSAGAQTPRRQRTTR